MIDKFLDTLVTLSQLPREVWAPILGLLAAWGLTQRLKFLLPDRWSAKAREVSTQTLAFTVGMVVTAAMYGVVNPLGWIVGFVVGLASPALWNIGMLVLGWWKPELAKLLSQSVRSAP